MKPILSLLLLLFIISCKKENLSIQEEIIGKWELQKSFRTAWTPETEHPPGNGTIIEFDKTNYYRQSNGQPAQTGSYRIVKDTARYGSGTDRIIYDQGLNPIKEFVQIKENSLYFTMDAKDGASISYRRIQ